MSGYAALQESAAWLDLSSRGKIHVRGEDRVHFLHAMSSQDVERLQPGQGTHAFFLDAQGRIQADSRLLAAADHVLLDTEPERTERLRAHLEKFIIMDDVALGSQGEALGMISVEGPRSEEIVGKIFGGLPEEPHDHVEREDTRVIRASLTGQPGFWLLGAAEGRAELVARLQEAGAVGASAEEARTVRVENQVPRCGDDYSESNIPQETQQLAWLSFTKGCYIGQEIVERVRSRGQVNRLLVGIELEGRRPPSEGASVVFGGKPAGKATSLAYSPALGRVVGFAMLRREAATAGATISVEGLAGRVREPGAR